MFPTHHIPPTDCPYMTDIYFISIRRVVHVAPAPAAGVRISTEHIPFP